jgi:hypothetical protein
VPEPSRPQGDHDPAARIAELEDEVRSLRKDLWRARDATIGATASAGSYKARNVELEMLIHQLRVELGKTQSALLVSQGSLSGKVNALANMPRRAARKLLGP